MAQVSSIRDIETEVREYLAAGEPLSVDVDALVGKFVAVHGLVSINAISSDEWTGFLQEFARRH